MKLLKTIYAAIYMTIWIPSVLIYVMVYVGSYALWCLLTGRKFEK